MRGTITYSSYRDNAYTSYVRKSTKYGEFSAVTAATDEDKDIANRWDGCRFAEYLCDIQAMRTRAQTLRERYIGVLNSFNNIKKSMYDHDTNCDTAYIIHLMKRQLKHAENQWKEAAQEYSDMTERYKTFCDNVLKQRRETRDQIEQLHQEASE